MNNCVEEIKVTKCKLCPLCKNDVETLEDSHILPKQLYKFLRQKKLDIIQHDKKTDKLIISDKQWKEYLLCGECEDLFQKKEHKFSLFQRAIERLDRSDREKLICRYSDHPNDFKVNFSPNFLKKDNLDTIKYFVLSILIRQHYLSPLKFSDEIIFQIERYLKDPTVKFPVDMVINFHSGKQEFPAFTAPIILDQIDNKHVSFLAFNMFVHITFTDNKIQRYETISCTPEDFYEPDYRNLPFNQMIKEARKLYQKTEKTPKVMKFFEGL